MQGHPWLNSWFEDSLGSMRSYLKMSKWIHTIAKTLQSLHYSIWPTVLSSLDFCSGLPTGFWQESPVAFVVISELPLDDPFKRDWAASLFSLAVASWCSVCSQSAHEVPQCPPSSHRLCSSLLTVRPDILPHHTTFSVSPPSSRVLWQGRSSSLSEGSSPHFPQLFVPITEPTSWSYTSTQSLRCACLLSLSLSSTWYGVSYLPFILYQNTNSKKAKVPQSSIVSWVAVHSYWLMGSWKISLSVR